MNTHTLSVLVENKPGVLARVAGLFARRGYNIESLAVGPTERTDISRITLQVAVSTPQVLEQIVKQLNKLVEVLKIIEIVQLFRGKTVDVHRDSMTIEATGSPDKLRALLEMLAPYGIRELVQSGLVALGRGSRSLTERAKIDKSRNH